jgi:hypothetical protein
MCSGVKQSFLNGKTIKKGPPKQKLGADIVKMLDDLEESKIVGLKVTVKRTTGLIKVFFGNFLIQMH